MLALAVAAYGVTAPSADPPVVREPEASLPAARLFMLLPDGRVEISDGLARRSFRWDGHDWLDAPPVQEWERQAR